MTTLPARGARAVGGVGERAHPTLNEWAPFVAVSLPAVFAILWMARYLTFFADELSFFDGLAPTTPLEYLRQWNSHWSTGLYAVLMGLDTLFGHRFYLPYQLALMGFHVITAAALYALVRIRSSTAIAVALTVILLVLGSAAEDLFWVWQIGFIGAAAAGTLAMVAMVRERPAIAALLLVVASAFSGMGLPFIAACGVYAVLTRRRSALLMAIPVGVFVAWRVIFASATPDVTASQVTVVSIITYSGRWILDTLGSVSGLGIAGGVALVALTIAAVAMRRVSPLAAAAIAGLVAEFVIVAAARSGAEYYVRPRYIYPAAVFILVATSQLLATVHRPTLRLAAAALLAIAIATNAALLVVGAELRWGAARYQLPDAWGCIDQVAIPDYDYVGLRVVPPEGRCPD